MLAPRRPRRQRATTGSPYGRLRIGAADGRRLACGGRHPPRAQALVEEREQVVHDGPDRPVAAENDVRVRADLVERLPLGDG